MTTRIPHKHAEVIKAWADGAEIEYRSDHIGWYTADEPTWDTDREYRVKPERKPNAVTVHLLFCTAYTLRSEIDINDPANPVLVSSTLEKP